MTVNAQKRGWSVAVVLLGASLLTGAAFANVSDFLGNWVNTDPGASGITRIIVTPMGDNQVRVHVYGQCQPTDCDWGVRPGHSYTENPGSTDVRSIAAEFNAGYSSKTIILRRAPGGDMRFEVLTAFTDGSGAMIMTSPVVLLWIQIGAFPAAVPQAEDLAGYIFLLAGLESA